MSSGSGENGVAALLVALGGDEPERLVVAPEPHRLGGGERLAVDGDLVVAGDVQRRARDHPAVHRDPAGGDHRLGHPARGDAGPRQPPRDPLAGASSWSIPAPRPRPPAAQRETACRARRAPEGAMTRFAPHMEAALAEARAAFARAETPVGAVIVDPAGA